MSNHEKLQTFDLQTAIKLITPRELGITLVPLSSVEEAEDSALWASVFLGIFTTLLGALLSLLFTAYQNSPVLILLSLFTAIFLILFVIFAFKVRTIRHRARENAIGPKRSEGVEISEREKQLEEVANVYRYMTTLRRQVFGEDHVLEFGEFANRFPRTMKEGEYKPGFAERFIETLSEIGMVEIFEDEKGRRLIRMNESFMPEVVYPNLGLMGEVASEGEA